MLEDMVKVTNWWNRRHVFYIRRSEIGIVEDVPAGYDFDSDGHKSRRTRVTGVAGVGWSPFDVNESVSQILGETVDSDVAELPS